MAKVIKANCSRVPKKVLNILEDRGVNNDRLSVQQLHDAMISGKDVDENSPSFLEVVLYDLPQRYSQKDILKTLLFLGIESKTFLKAIISNTSSLQLLIPGINIEKESLLFLGAEFLKGIVMRLFKRGLFKAVYIDTTKYSDPHVDLTILRFSYGPAAFNKNIAKFKLLLVNLIIKKLGLSNLTTQPQFTVFNVILNPTLIENRYKLLMSHPVLTLFVNNALLNMRTLSKEDTELFGAIYILNNFDKLVSTNLSGILKATNTNIGEISNIEYAVAEEGSQPNWWASQSIESSNAELYASSVGKFILSTILKTDSYGKVIEGEYYSERDVFNLSRLLRLAEAEYPHYFPSNKVPSMKVDCEFAVKHLLLDLKDKPTSIVAKHWNEVAPIYNFLFNGTDTDYSVLEVINKELFNGNAKIIGNINDVLGKIILELSISNSPDYLEYTTTGINGKGEEINAAARSFNDGLTTKTTGNIRDKIIFGLSDLLVLDPSELNPYFKGTSTYKLSTITSYLELFSLDDFDKLNSAFRKLFDIDLDPDGLVLEDSALGSQGGLNFVKRLQELLYNISSAFNLVKKDSDIEEQYADLAKAIQDLFFNPKDTTKSNSRKFIDNIALCSVKRKSSQARTIIRNSTGKAIPINRLESTGMEKHYLIKEYKKASPVRDLTNFFIANPHVLTKFKNKKVPTTPGVIESDNDINLSYGMDTGIVLETITQFGSNSASDSSAKESTINSILGNFLSLDLEGKYAELTFTFSDKSTKLLDMINTQSIIESYGEDLYDNMGNIIEKRKIDLNKSILDMTSDELLGLFLFYRRNELLDRVNHILHTWHTIFPEANILYFSDSLLYIQILSNPQDLTLLKYTKEQTVYDFVKQLWNLVNELLKHKQAEINQAKQAGRKVKKFTDTLEDRVREILKTNDRFELVIDLDYSDYGGTALLNKNIWNHFAQTKSLDTFKNIQYKIALDLKNDPWIIELQNKIIGPLPELPIIANLVKTYLTAHNFENIGLELSEIPLELFLKKTVLDNFARTQVLALHWKGAHLDKIKKQKDYDEMSDEEELNIVFEEKKRFEAGGKRPVDLVGTGKCFLQGRLGGVPYEIKVAMTHEPEELVWDATGQQESLEVLNGSARIHPIYARMESDSLPGENFTGMNRKTLGSGISDFRNTLFKYAEYPIDNFHIRESMRSKYKLYYTFKKMSGGLGTEEFEGDIDLTKNFLGQTLSINDWNNARPVYFAKGCYYYLIVGFTKVGENTYDFNIREVNEYGEEYDFEGFLQKLFLQYKGVKITNLFLLWEVLGGSESMQLGKEGRLDYSEDSMDMLYNFVVGVGSILPGAKECNRRTVHQPLINKFIAMLASDSGIKRGIANLNNHVVAYQDPNVSLNYIYTKTANFKKQMDPTHEIENMSDVTEMTLAISSLALNGYSRPTAARTYNAIATIITTKLKKLLNKSEMFSEDDINRIVESLSKEIKKTIDHDNTAGRARSMAMAVEKTLHGLPLSDRTFARILHKNIVQEINKRALRRKNPGMGAVINPSSNTILLYKIKGKEYLYSDLIKLARSFVTEAGYTFEGMSTDEMVDLYVGCLYHPDFLGDPKKLLKEIEESKGLTEKLEIILENITLRNAIPFNKEIEKSESLELAIKLTCDAVPLSNVRDLETIYIIKDNKVRKVSFDSLDIIMDTNQMLGNDIVYIDPLIPADLKPEFITFELLKIDKETGEESYEQTNQYLTVAALLGYINHLLNDKSDGFGNGKTIDKILESLEDEGKENIENCKQL